MKSKMKINSFQNCLKKFFLALVLLVSVTSFAQEKKDRENRSPEQKLQAQVDRLTTELSLNEKQVVQIKALSEKRIAKRDAFKSKLNEVQKASKEEKKVLRASMKAEQESAKAEMKEILTAEQYTKWESNLEDRKEKMIEKRGNQKKSKR
jgi:periplasmic protein CpxP/Spy